MTIADLDALIEKAKQEIQDCKDLIKILEALSTNASNCARNITSVYNNLSVGLVIAGASLSSVQGRASKMQALQGKAETAIGEANARILTLESDIISYENQKQSLWVRARSFFKGNKGPKNEIKE